MPARSLVGPRELTLAPVGVGQALSMLNAEIEQEGSFWVERVVWFALYEAARESTKCGSAIWLRT